MLPFKDPDGDAARARRRCPGIEGEPAWSDGDVPPEDAIRGFHGVSLLLAEAAPTGAILTDVLGFAEVGREESTIRFKADAAAGGIVDIRVAGDFLPGGPAPARCITSPSGPRMTTRSSR